MGQMKKNKFKGGFFLIQKSFPMVPQTIESGMKLKQQ